MKPPPLLLGLGLLFWGWQSGLIVVGAVLGAILESSRFIKARWDFSDEDFSRIWTLCSLLMLGAILFAFVDNQGPASFSGFFQDPNPNTQRGAGAASSRTAFAMFRWLPMIYFPFVAAQIFSTREAIPWKTISFLIRRKIRKAQKAGKPAPASGELNVAMPYFAVTMLGAAAHPPEGRMYFWGLSALMAWALWSQRQRRFATPVWIAAFVAAIVLGYAGQRGIGQAVRLMENFNPSWLSFLMKRRFDAEQSKTALGQVGELKLSGRIVVRLKPLNGSRAPNYLREASFRTYKGQTWYAEITEQNFEYVGESGQNTLVWPLPPLQSVTNTQSANIACYLDGGKALLPLPTGVSRLEKLNVIEVKKNALGAVLAVGPGLAMFDAQFTRDMTIDSPPEPSDVTNIPPREVAGLESAIQELQSSGLDVAGKLRAVNGFFANKFNYSTWQSPPKSSDTNETALSRFLLKTRSGHCEYFATATVLMLRKLGIPARYAVGFAVHETSGSGYVVRLRDAHAWTLVWDDAAKTWRDFDTTPASWIEAESRHSAWQWFADLRSRVAFEFAKIFRSGNNPWRQYLLWAIVPGVLILIYQIDFRRRKKQQRGKTAGIIERTDWPGLDSEFYQLEASLAERGVPRQPGEALSGWLERVAGDASLAEIRPALRELLRLHYRHRFDPPGLNETEREALRRQARACLDGLSGVRSGSVSVAGR